MFIHYSFGYSGRIKDNKTRGDKHVFRMCNFNIPLFTCGKMNSLATFLQYRASSVKEGSSVCKKLFRRDDWKHCRVCTNRYSERSPEWRNCLRFCVRIRIPDHVGIAFSEFFSFFKTSREEWRRSKKVATTSWIATRQFSGTNWRPFFTDWNLVSPPDTVWIGVKSGYSFNFSQRSFWSSGNTRIILTSGS